MANDSFMSKVKVNSHDHLQFSDPLEQSQSQVLETENKNLQRKINTLQETVGKLRKDFLKELLRSREANSMKPSNLPMKERLVDVRYFDELELVDRESRKILNTRLEEAKNQFESKVSDHLKYERSLVQQIAKLKAMESKYIKMMTLPAEDINKILSTFEQSSKMTETEAGKKVAEEFRKELRKIKDECDEKLKSE